MIDWIKRAVRWPWFGRKAPLLQSTVFAAMAERSEELNRRIIANAAKEATIAQKNVRLASIARTRGKLKDEIARLKRNRKRHSHLQAELSRLTRLELELEGGR